SSPYYPLNYPLAHESCSSCSWELVLASSSPLSNSPPKQVNPTTMSPTPQVLLSSSAVSVKHSELLSVESFSKINGIRIWLILLQRIVFLHHFKFLDGMQKVLSCFFHNYRLMS